MNDPILGKIRESRGRLRSIERAMNAEYAVRRKLFAEARAKGIALRHIAQAAGVSEGAVSLALRTEKETKVKDTGS